MHKHRVSREGHDRGFTDPVNPHNQNRAAHGNIERMQYCSCGAWRKVLINGLHREVGDWQVDNGD